MAFWSFFLRLAPSKISTTASDENNGKKNIEKKNASPPKVIKLDSKGIPYRDCPECEGKMYKEGNTWICDLLGNSYEE